MKRNLGETKLRKRHRSSYPMQEFDRMPKTLRDWMNNAVLPWRAISVYRAYQKALIKSGDPDYALHHLNLLQKKRLSEETTI